jgi:hypothetical protein
MATRALYLYPHRKARIVPVRFKRAITGKPIALRPDLDDRGFADNAHAPIVGMIPRPAENDHSNDITLELSRESISDDAPIFLKSSDESVVLVDVHHCDPWVPANGELRGMETHHFRLHALQPSNALVFIQARFGREDGPVIGELAVQVSSLLSQVNLVPHIVNITSAANPLGVMPASGLTDAWGDIVNMMNAIWKPGGIQFNASPINLTNPITYNSGTVAGDLPFSDQILDLNLIIQQRWLQNVINVYLVNQIDGGETVGIGINPDPSNSNSYTAFGIIRPCIVLAAQPVDIQRAACTLAHEAGHYFRLRHPSDPRNVANSKKDAWWCRNIMFNFSGYQTANPPFSLSVPRIPDVGYGLFADGRARRGAMIMFKNLARVDNDDQVRIARELVQQGGASLYSSETRLPTSP